MLALHQGILAVYKLYLESFNLVDMASDILWCAHLHPADDVNR
jgi:hypothetical protein